MPEFIVNIFRKSNTDDDRTAYGKACGVYGIFWNLLLVAGKLIAGLFSHSVSIIADAMNNLSDAGSSITTFAGFKLSEQKPDHEHPYGHGRMEYISGFIVSIIIIIVGFELGHESVNKILSPTETGYSIREIIILLAAILVKCYMAFYNYQVAKRINSDTIKAAGTDSLTDCISTGVVVICAIINMSTGLVLDGYAGLLVSCFVLFQGISAAKDFINQLLGLNPEPEFLEEIKDLAINYDENIIGVHDLMVHDYGPSRRIVSLHAEVPADGNILELHDIIDNLEKELGNKLKCIATIHMDPVENNNPEVQELKKKVKEIVSTLDEGLSIHDFRIVSGDTHTNLLFDVVIPFDCKLEVREVREKIQKLVQIALGENYYTVIDVDRV